MVVTFFKFRIINYCQVISTHQTAKPSKQKDLYLWHAYLVHKPILFSITSVTQYVNKELVGQ